MLIHTHVTGDPSPRRQVTLSLYDVPSGTTAPVEARRLPSGVDVVVPVVGEALSPSNRQHVARAIQDGIADDGDPPVHCRAPLFEPADVDCESHEVPHDVVAVLCIVGH